MTVPIALPYQWVGDHLAQILGWGLVVLGFYKTSRFFAQAGVTFAEVGRRVLVGESTLHLVATNHLPHLQLEMEKVNATLVGLRDDLRSKN